MSSRVTDRVFLEPGRRVKIRDSKFIRINVQFGRTCLLRAKSTPKITPGSPSLKLRPRVARGATLYIAACSRGGVSRVLPGGLREFIVHRCGESRTSGISVVRARPLHHVRALAMCFAYARDYVGIARRKGAGEGGAGGHLEGWQTRL